MDSSQSLSKTTEHKVKQAIAQGAFAQAIELANQALLVINDNHEKVPVLYVLAVAQRMAGKTDEAIDSNQQIIKINDRHARAQQELGYNFKSRSEHLLSAKHFYSATQINPALLASWQALFNYYKQTDNHKAMELAKAQITYLESLPKAVLHARDLMYEGQLAQADTLCRQYLQGDKHNAEAMLLLAEIGIALKTYNEAEFLLESCLELYPDHTSAGIEYLSLLNKMGRFKDAEKVADDLLKGLVDNPQILGAKATALVGLGNIKPAIKLYQTLIKSNPEHAHLYLLLAHAYKAMGELKQAVSAYQQAYRLKPDFGDAYWSLANTKTYAFGMQELKDMQSQVEQCSNLDDKIHFCFALGKAFEDKKNFDDSFQYYAHGNSLKQATTGYQPELFEQQVDNHKRIFTSELFNRLGNVGASAADPIFIVGLPRAGSTLLEQILASHSQVDGTMELHNIIALASRLRNKQHKYPDIVSELDTSYFARFGEQYIQDTRVYRDKAPLFIDKMPNNFLYIGLIKLILPNAKVIDARREPMACCFSGFKQLFGEGQEFSYGLESIGRYYAAYMDMMAHWNTVLPDFVLHIQHEDVIDNLATQVERILDFCNLEFEQACIDFHKTKRTVKTPSSEQVRQPIFKTSMQQHMNYSKHLEPLAQIVDPFIKHKMA